MRCGFSYVNYTCPFLSKNYYSFQWSKAPEASSRPAPRGSESRTRPRIAQHDPHLAKAEAYLSLRVSCAILLQFAFWNCLVGCSAKVHTPGNRLAAAAAVACTAVGCPL